MLLNIIHPYIYKVHGDTLKTGPIEEFNERDKRINTFVNTALNSNVEVLLHKYHREFFLECLEKVAFESDSLFNFMSNPKIEKITTNSYGCPIPDEKPEELSKDISSEDWAEYKKTFISHSELKDKIKGHDKILFIGGVLESCVANVSNYFHKFYREENQNLFYVKDLCVSRDNDLWNSTKHKLDEANIKNLDYDSAIKLFN